MHQGDSTGEKSFHVCIVQDGYAQKAVKAAHVGNSYIGVLTVFCLISDVLVTAGV